jgi:hypothetical protein
LRIISQLALAQWEPLLSQARRARRAPRLADLFAERGWLQATPDRVRVHQENGLKQARRQRDEVTSEIDRIAHALRDLPGPAVLLKGATYVADGLPPARARLFTDVDVLAASACAAAGSRAGTVR